MTNQISRKRKRGSFSCDRCKVKKIGCYRPNGTESIHDACVTCQVLKVDCSTTIQRKKRKPTVDPIPKQNQELVVRILNSLYPDMNCNDMSELSQLYESIGHSPSNRSSAGESDYQEFEDTKPATSYIIRSGKSVNGLESTATGFGLELNGYDRVIYDSEGITHYVGSFGFSNSLTILLNNLIRHTHQRDLYSIRFIKSMNKRGSIISSFAETINPEICTSFQSEKFPLVCYFSRQESDFYVDRFFHYSNVLLDGMSRSNFDLIYEKLWKIHLGELNPDCLSNAQYCCVYSVWITGVSLELHPQASMQITYESMNRYINLIKFLLSDIYLIPSPDGILCLLLLSSFFERNMQIETAYILCQTAACHAMSCGLHRESMTTDNTAYLWWSIFDREMKLGLYLGRSSTIPIRQVNLDYETRFKEFTSENLDCNLLVTELNRIVYLFLCNRTKLPISSKLLTEEHLNSALHIDEMYSDFYLQLPGKFKRVEGVESAEAEVMMNYYLCYVASTLPFTLYALADFSLLDTRIDKLIKLVDSCVDASTKAVDLIIAVALLSYEDRLDSFEASLSSYIMASFVSGALFFNDPIVISKASSKCDKVLTKILGYAKSLREYNQRKINSSRGTVRIRRYWIEVLNEDLNFLYKDEPNGQLGNEKLWKAILGDFVSSPSPSANPYNDKNVIDFSSTNHSGLQMNNLTQSSLFEVEDLFDQFFASGIVNPDM